MEDPNLFSRWFKRPDEWVAWRAFIAALFGLPMGEAELAIYGQCTGRTIAPTEPSTEAFLVVGRRGGKSFILALIGVFLATFRDYRPYLQPGERATITDHCRRPTAGSGDLSLYPGSSDPGADAGSSNSAADRG